MKLIIIGVVLMILAIILPPAIASYWLMVSVFLSFYAVGLSLFTIGFGRFMSLPGFKKWNAPVKRRANVRSWIADLRG
jgi:hypothetical protein